MLKAENTSNVTEPIKGTTSTSVFKIFLCAVILGPLLMIGFMWLADKALTPEDAKAFKGPLLGLWAMVTGSSVLGVVFSHLLSRFGKVNTQTKQAVAQTVADAAIAKLPGSVGLNIEGSAMAAALLNQRYANNTGEVDAADQLAAQAIAEQEAIGSQDDEGLQTTGEVTPD